MGKQQYDLQKVVLGHCPHCDEAYGIMKDMVSGAIAYEFCDCFCQEEKYHKKPRKNHHKKLQGVA